MSYWDRNKEEEGVQTIYHFIPITFIREAKHIFSKSKAVLHFRFIGKHKIMLLLCENENLALLRSSWGGQKGREEGECCFLIQSTMQVHETTYLGNQEKHNLF